ncbi:hypothetical protein GQ600_9807 [Phytophthora cactorum]|nr:hypothetical protein GQ600_9807 [Phytophthora cactorum]
MLVGDFSVDTAGNGGWMTLQGPPLIDLVDFNEVHWTSSQATWNWFGIFIVEFSLVFNHELKAVNWSNFVSDRLGGYTGSYILL